MSKIPQPYFSKCGKLNRISTILNRNLRSFTGSQVYEGQAMTFIASCPINTSYWLDLRDVNLNYSAWNLNNSWNKKESVRTFPLGIKSRIRWSHTPQLRLGLPGWKVKLFCESKKKIFLLSLIKSESEFMRSVLSEPRRGLVNRNGLLFARMLMCRITMFTGKGG